MFNIIVGIGLIIGGFCILAKEGVFDNARNMKICPKCLHPFECEDQRRVYCKDCSKPKTKTYYKY